RIFRRRHPEVTLEDALKVVRRVAHGHGQLVEGQGLFGMLDQFHRPGHRLAIASDFVRFAPQARAISRGACFLCRGVEMDVLTLRTARRAARLAVDAGRAHRADDAAIPRPVATHEGRPGSVGIEARDVAHGSRSRLVVIGCKAGHRQLLSIFAEKQPRVALWAWIVSIFGLTKSLRIPASASPCCVRIASIIIPALSNPRSDNTRDANTGAISSRNSAASCAPSLTKIAWLAR